MKFAWMVMGPYTHRMEPGPDCESERIGLEIHHHLNRIGKHLCLSVRSSLMEKSFNHLQYCCEAHPNHQISLITDHLSNLSPQSRVKSVISWECRRRSPE